MDILASLITRNMNQIRAACSQTGHPKLCRKELAPNSTTLVVGSSHRMVEGRGPCNCLLSNVGTFEGSVPAFPAGCPGDFPCKFSCGGWGGE